MIFRSNKIPTNLFLIVFLALAVGLLGQNKEKKYSKHDPCSAEMSAQRIEAAIRERIHKPEGEITQADYQRITYLPLTGKELTNIALLAKLFFPPYAAEFFGFRLIIREG